MRVFHYNNNNNNNTRRSGALNRKSVGYNIFIFFLCYSDAALQVYVSIINVFWSTTQETYGFIYFSQNFFFFILSSLRNISLHLDRVYYNILICYTGFHFGWNSLNVCFYMETTNNIFKYIVLRRVAVIKHIIDGG